MASKQTSVIEIGRRAVGHALLVLASAYLMMVALPPLARAYFSRQWPLIDDLAQCLGVDQGWMLFAADGGDVGSITLVLTHPGGEISLAPTWPRSHADTGYSLRELGALINLGHPAFSEETAEYLLAAINSAPTQSLPIERVEVRRARNVPYHPTDGAPPSAKKLVRHHDVRLELVAIGGVIQKELALVEPSRSRAAPITTQEILEDGARQAQRIWNGFNTIELRLVYQTQSFVDGRQASFRESTSLVASRPCP